MGGHHMPVNCIIHSWSSDTKDPSNKRPTCWCQKEEISPYRISKDYYYKAALVFYNSCCMETRIHQVLLVALQLLVGMLLLESELVSSLLLQALSSSCWPFLSCFPWHQTHPEIVGRDTNLIYSSDVRLSNLLRHPISPCLQEQDFQGGCSRCLSPTCFWCFVCLL